MLSWGSVKLINQKLKELKLLLFKDNRIWWRNGKTIACWIFGGNEGRRKSLKTQRENMDAIVVNLKL